MVNKEEIIRGLKDRKIRKKCPFDATDLKFKDTELKDGFEADTEMEVQVYVCPTCGYRAKFIKELSATEYRESYEARGNQKRLPSNVREEIQSEVQSETNVTQ